MIGPDRTFFIYETWVISFGGAGRIHRVTAGAI
jgi:hypothetical protein